MTFRPHRPRSNVTRAVRWIVSDLAVCWRVNAHLNHPMEPVVSSRSRHAQRLFAGIAVSYERVATFLSLGQDPRWRHALVAAVHAKPDDRLLDVATSTGMVAHTLEDQYGSG